MHSRLSPFDGYLLGLLWRFQRRWPGARFWIGVDPPHHGRVAVTFPRILNQRLSRVRSAVELFVLVDCHSEADVDIWTATMASTYSQLDEKVADLLYRRGPDQPSSSSLARRVRVQPLLLSLLLFVRWARGHRHLDLFKGPWSLLWGRGEMADRWPDRISLRLRAAVLSVCSLLLIMFLPCRLIIDPGGSVGPRGTGCDSDWKLVLLQPGLDTQFGGTPSVCSRFSLTT